jgi:hypothetical protein
MSNSVKRSMYQLKNWYKKRQNILYLYKWILEKVKNYKLLVQDKNLLN